MPGGGYCFPDGYRTINTATSEDFIGWTKGQLLDFGDAPKVQLYTHATQPYYRAPHIFVGFPLRYIPWHKSAEEKHAFGELSDVLFMSSRDGLHFQLWDEAFIRPGLQKRGIEHNRWGGHVNNTVAAGILETKSDIPGAPNDLSIYSTEGYYSGEGCQLRRFTLRIDGFVSV